MRGKFAVRHDQEVARVADFSGRSGIRVEPPEGATTAGKRVGHEALFLTVDARALKSVSFIRRLISRWRVSH